jgi:rhodanese-related sulfurtransferase
MFLFDEATPNPLGYGDIDPARVATVRGHVRIVDVREADELGDELGHIEGSEHVPLDAVEVAARSWNKAQEIVLVCRSGRRSARAASALAALGFRHVMNMRGGMLGWREAALPTAR